ncbi:anti-sigma factor [Tsuneonella sp. YG55]|uniref:Anti-sigma factor n=1 Tax=Tsuneonella litorea TaxID=2976475 RepID=A0A9X3AMU5_9SPHN|nr:anti-sigma factor [Tsuneonella litorea]MCT2558887.1 anti-sigma factor [Tsuneonella litorea]
MTPDDRLAAEFAIGLLEGQDLLDARGRRASDPAFAKAVDWWEARLAPLLDTIPAVVPPEYLLARISAAMADTPDGGAEVVRLRQRVRFWQRGAAAGAIAASAALAALVLTPQNRTPADVPVRAASAPLVASIPIGDSALRLGVTYLPDRKELLVSASGLASDGVHDHELWLVPDGGGALRSLGVVQPGRERRVSLDPATAALIHDGSAMVLTREPLGGKPPAADAGPVVAEGSFDRV